jgi:hypothetical protein
MENITAEFVCFKAYHKHKPPVLGNSGNLELTEGNNIYIGQLHLVELTAEFSKFLDYKNDRNGNWEVCEDSDSSTDLNKAIYNENVTLKPERQKKL